jgi:excisionase family DNA binding protein
MSQENTMTPNDDLRLLTTGEVAKLLGTSSFYVREHATIKEPLIKSVWLGRLRRFRRQDVEAFVTSQLDSNPRALRSKTAKKQPKD